MPWQFNAVGKAVWIEDENRLFEYDPLRRLIILRPFGLPPRETGAPEVTGQCGCRFDAKTRVPTFQHDDCQRGHILGPVVEQEAGRS